MLETVQLLKNTPGLPDKGLFTLIEMNARELYKNTGPDAQLHLEIRIKGLQAELSFLKKRGRGDITEVYTGCIEFVYWLMKITGRVDDEYNSRHNVIRTPSCLHHSYNIPRRLRMLIHPGGKLNA